MDREDNIQGQMGSVRGARWESQKEPKAEVLEIKNTVSGTKNGWALSPSVK